MDLHVRKRLNTGKLFALEKLKRSATAGGDVCDAVSYSRGIHCGN
jgi:hypothetical protein